MPSKRAPFNPSHRSVKQNLENRFFWSNCESPLCRRDHHCDHQLEYYEAQISDSLWKFVFCSSWKQWALPAHNEGFVTKMLPMSMWNTWWFSQVMASIRDALSPPAAAGLQFFLDIVCGWLSGVDEYINHSSPRITWLLFVCHILLRVWACLDAQWALLTHIVHLQNQIWATRSQCRRYEGQSQDSGQEALTIFRQIKQDIF